MRLVAPILSLVLFAPFTHAATITVGTSSGPSNAYPLSGYSGEYQQVYSASAFNSPITISAISFAESPSYTGSVSGNYSLYLSTTSKTVNGLSTTYATNLGADNALFASGTFSNSGTTLTFTASDPFLYNPSAGNLLLDVFNDGSTSNYVFFLNGTSSNTSRVFNFGGSGAPTADSRGLQTTFTYTNAVAATPEPSSLVLLGTGLTAMLGMVRRRRQF